MVNKTYMMMRDMPYTPSFQSMLPARLVSAPLQQAQVRLHKRITAHRPHGFTRCTLAANCSIKGHLH